MNFNIWLVFGLVPLVLVIVGWITLTESLIVIGVLLLTMYAIAKVLL